jgi:branched-chain amino acid transport system permease protein
MSIVIQLIEGSIYGLALGMLYVMVALGLTLIFGLMDVINFAHGAMVTLGAYLGFTTAAATGSFWIALVLPFFVVGLLGAIIERGLIKRLYDLNHIYQLLLTFGISLVIEGLIIVQYGQEARQLSRPAMLAGSPVTIGPASVPKYRLFLIIFTLVLVTVIWYIIQRSKLGLIIKAGIEDRERTQLLGVHLSRVNVLVFSVGAGLAAMAGVLAAPLLGVTPQLGTGLLITSFVVVIIGGLGNIKGTIIAALLLGIVYNVTLFLRPGLANSMIFVMMLIVLFLKPEGLFGGTTA